MEKIRIVSDGPPGPQSGRFIEVEDMKGKSLNAGEWRQISEDLWALEIPDFRQLQSENDALRERLARLVEGAKQVQIDYDTLTVYCADPLIRWRTFQATVIKIQEVITQVKET